MIYVCSNFQLCEPCGTYLINECAIIVSSVCLYFACSCSDVEKIQSGIGDKVAVFLQYLSSFVANYVIAFVLNWKLALVCVVVLPIFIALGIATAKVWCMKLWCRFYQSSFIGQQDNISM